MKSQDIRYVNFKRSLELKVCYIGHVVYYTAVAYCSLNIYYIIN